jgi:hypothetical protein
MQDMGRHDCAPRAGRESRRTSRFGGVSLQSRARIPGNRTPRRDRRYDSYWTNPIVRRATIRARPGDRNVAVAVVRCGRSQRSLSRKALVARLAQVDRAGRSVLARTEQASAPPSAEKQGSRPLTHGAEAAGEGVGLASGEYGVPWIARREPCVRVGAGICRPRRSRGSLCPAAVTHRAGFDIQNAAAPHGTQ